MTHHDPSFSNQRVVVIGGASGIGFAVAQLAQGQGAQVVVASSNAAKIEAAVHRLPGITGLSVDLRAEASVATFFESLGAFDHLVITAGDWGGPMFASVRDIDLGEAQALMAVRFWGVLAAIKHCARTIARDGSIVLTSGMLTHRPRKGAPLASAVGGLIESLTRGLALDLAPVRVNAVCPGMTLSEHVRQMPEPMLRSAVSMLPVPRAASPAEAAQAYAYLMLNRYATGQILPVDGGGLLI